MLKISAAAGSFRAYPATGCEQLVQGKTHSRAAGQHSDRWVWSCHRKGGCPFPMWQVPGNPPMRQLIRYG